MASWFYTFVEIHQMVHGTQVHFIGCKLYFNRVVVFFSIGFFKQHSKHSSGLEEGGASGWLAKSQTRSHFHINVFFMSF